MSELKRVVVQIGPAPGTPGGMAAVIEEIVQMDFAQYEQVVRSTWGSRRGLLSMFTALMTITRLAIGRGRWHLAHVHLSEYGSFVREGAVVLAARALRRPAVVTLHGARFDQQVVRHPRITRLVLESSSMVLCLGDFQREMVEGVAPRARAAVIANPLAATPGESPPRGASPSNAGANTGKRVVFVGEVGARKGVDRLIEAWATLRVREPNAELRLIGPIHEFSTDELRGARYLGPMNRAQARAEMADANVVVLPSRAEVLPMVLLESLAAGTPAIYTTVGEWKNFEDCRYVDLIDSRPPAGEPELIAALANAIHARLRNPVTETGRVEARHWVEQFAGSEKVRNDLSRIYDQALIKV